MKALVVGKGGREHALVKSLAQSSSIETVFALPGNDGMKEAQVLSGQNTSNEVVLEAIVNHKIDLVVVGPEAELAEGLCSFLREKGVLCVGPGQMGAQLESSKIFSKEFMVKAGVPTSQFYIVSSEDEVVDKATNFDPPYVLKADGLCAGKGVYICSTFEDLQRAAKELFSDKIFGNAGSKALLEEFKEGYELSYLILTDGKTFEPLPLCQDHKRLAENDEGPNTGGMGAVGPLKIEPHLDKRILEEVVQPSVKQLQTEGMDFRGILYIGLMISGEDISVLEYNVRFGDPEAQVILPLLDGDWGQVFLSLAQGNLSPLAWKSKYATCVVLAAENYPVSPIKGAVIEGELDDNSNESYFIHAGTKYSQGQWLTAGGRVLNAIGIGDSLKESQSRAYKKASQVNWAQMQMRQDIGAKVL